MLTGLRRVTVTLAIAITACRGGGATTRAPGVAPSPAAPSTPDLRAPPAGPAVTSVSFAEVGLETASLDPSVSPCDDFYQFACGGWLAAHDIPADEARYGRFSQIEEANNTAVRAILDGLLAEPAAAGEVDHKLADFYGACLDVAAIEKRGLGGLAPLLGPIDKIKDAASLQTALIALHRHGIGALWSLGMYTDIDDDAATIAYLGPAGLGLPERDYYTDADHAPMRAAYQAHLARLFGLLGKGKASARLAAGVMAFETELAAVSLAPGDLHRIDIIYHPTDLDGLADAAAKVDWPAYFAALGNPAPGRISVMSPAFVGQLDHMISSTRPEIWRAYLTARAVSASALALPRAIDDEIFALARAVSGAEAQPPRWRRCVEATEASMPEYLGQLFVAAYFPGDSKAIITRLVTAIVDVMSERTDALPWMSPDARRQSRRELAELEAMVGYPDTWRTYPFATRRDDFAANRLAAAAFEARRQVDKAGKPYDRAEWLMPVFMASAYHNSAANNIALPAGLLRPPFFGAERSIAVNLGGIGMAVGHELTHGYGDEATAGGRGRCLARQYSTFEVLPGNFVNGALTLNENLADLGGVKHAFLAYRKLRAAADPVVVADGFTEDQQFFLGLGQAWCSKDRPEEARKRLVSDLHAPPRWRINGTLRNLPEFARAFSCRSGAPMAPVHTCAVW